jgi:hypothetical protein
VNLHLRRPGINHDRASYSPSRIEVAVSSSHSEIHARSAVMKSSGGWLIGAGDRARRARPVGHGERIAKPGDRCGRGATAECECDSSDEIIYTGHSGHPPR